MVSLSIYREPEEKGGAGTLEWATILGGLYTCPLDHCLGHFEVGVKAEAVHLLFAGCCLPPLGRWGAQYDPHGDAIPEAPLTRVNCLEFSG